jgi:hypothetical protein
MMGISRRMSSGPYKCRKKSSLCGVPRTRLIKKKEVPMLHAEFETKIYEMIGRLPEALKKECDRLWKSGAIDPEKFGDDYRLPKAILTVALENMACQWMPMSDDLRKDVKNLRHF